MKIQVRGESVKMDPEARALIIKALNDAAFQWLNYAAGGDCEADDQAKVLADVGNVKSFATLLEPKAEE